MRQKGRQIPHGRGVLGLLALVLAAALLLSATPGITHAGSLTATFRLVSNSNPWYEAEYRITNSTTSTINGWIVEFDLPQSTTISTLWHGSYTRSGTRITVRNASWNSSIPPQGSIVFGWTGQFQGSWTNPTNCRINGMPCSGGSAPTPTSTAIATPTPQPTAPATATPLPGGSKVLFDDFNYSSSSDPLIAQRNWIVRTYSGGPGVPGAIWDRNNITFLNDPANSGNRLMQLAASTDGTNANTRQAEFYHQRKFYEGTYASRVRFTDAPLSGPDGDQIVQTFFTITPLAFDMDPNYGELDFEYLPNGGWGEQGPVMFMTSWETYQNDPWVADNVHTASRTSFSGWHTLVIQLAGGEIKYYIDGRLMATHSGHVYPETPMSLNYNLWFINGGLVANSTPRQYIQQVDWVYYTQNEVLSPAQAEARVAGHRSQGISHIDTVPAWNP